MNKFTVEQVNAVLQKLGHIHQPDIGCRARVKELPMEMRPPGPPHPPLWCCLRDGHEGPHKYHGGGYHPPIPFRTTDEIEYREARVGICLKCNKAWPCDTAMVIHDLAARLREDDENAKDAARYRWLRDNPEHSSHPYFENGRWHMPYQASTARGFGAGVGVETFDTLEAAIDAAMSEQGEG